MPTKVNWVSIIGCTFQSQPANVGRDTVEFVSSVRIRTNLFDTNQNILVNRGLRRSTQVLQSHHLMHRVGNN